MKKTHASCLPKQVPISPTQQLTVIETELDGRLARLNMATMELFVDERQDDIVKARVFFQELCHIAQVKLVRGGVMPAPFPDLITSEMSGVLFWMLAGSGLWKGLNASQALRFVRNLAREREAAEVEALVAPSGAEDGQLPTSEDPGQD